MDTNDTFKVGKYYYPIHANHCGCTRYKEDVLQKNIYYMFNKPNCAGKTYVEIEIKKRTHCYVWITVGDDTQSNKLEILKCRKNHRICVNNWFGGRRVRELIPQYSGSCINWGHKDEETYFIPQDAVFKIQKWYRKNKKIREDSAVMIQRSFRNCRYNPRYKICIGIQEKFCWELGLEDED